LANVVVMIDSAAGETIAAPIPEPRARHQPRLGLSQAPSSEARREHDSPSMNIFRRPIKSARRPPSSKKPPT